MKRLILLLPALLLLLAACTAETGQQPAATESDGPEIVVYQTPT